MTKSTNLSLFDIERMLMDAARMGSELSLIKGRALLRHEQQSVAIQLTRKPKSMLENDGGRICGCQSK